MQLKSKLLLLIALPAILLQLNSMANTQKHLVNKTFRIDQFSNTTNRSACKRENKKVMESFAKFPHEAYIAKNILDNIYSTNRSSFNAAKYMRNNLCIIIYKSDSVNAYVSPGNEKDGIILLSLAIFSKSNVEDEVAGIISHELAHLSMNHFNDRIVDLDINENVINYYQSVKSLRIDIKKQKELINEMISISEDGALKEKLKNLYTEGAYYLSKPIELAINEKMLLLKKYFSEIPSMYNLISKSTAKHNYQSRRMRYKIKKNNIDNFPRNYFEAWKEIEADEVGLELYLKAGYNHKYYNWLNTNGLSQNGSSENMCKAVYTEIELVDKHHPTHCWRLRNNQSEYQEHWK